MIFSSFRPAAPTFEADADGLALVLVVRCRADEVLVGGELAAGGELTIAGAGAGDEAGRLTSGDTAGSGELATVGVGGAGTAERDGVGAARDAGCAVHPDASSAASTAPAAARRMAPILADVLPGRPPIRIRVAIRFDPCGRRSVLLGAARSCAPTSARPSHPLPGAELLR